MFRSFWNTASWDAPIARTDFFFRQTYQHTENSSSCLANSKQGNRQANIKRSFVAGAQLQRSLKPKFGAPDMTWEGERICMCMHMRTYTQRSFVTPTGDPKLNTMIWFVAPACWNGGHGQRNYPPPAMGSQVRDSSAQRSHQKSSNLTPVSKVRYQKSSKSVSTP